MWDPGRDQFWPQWHNLSNFGRGHLDNVINYIWTFWVFLVSDKKSFENCILKTFLWPRDLLNMQPIRTIWTILEGDHSGTIPVELGQIPISGSGEEVVWSFPYIIQCKIVTTGAGSILTLRGIILTTFVEDG